MYDTIVACSLYKACAQGRIHGRGEGAIDPPPLRGMMVKKIETPGQSKVGFISPRMHQNSPFKAQKSKHFPGSGTDPYSPHPTSSAPSAPRSSRLRRSTSAPPFAPNHSFWIRPCLCITRQENALLAIALESFL